MPKNLIYIPQHISPPGHPNRLRRAVGYPDPPPMLANAVPCLLYARAWCIRHLLPPRPASLSTRRTPLQCVPGNPGLYVPAYDMYATTYTCSGYRIENIGPAGVCPGALADISASV